MPIRIMLLTQWFDPEPTFKGLVFARELSQQGFDVEVVTGFPNYPGGKIYPGYRIKWLQREIVDSVKITRVPLYPNHDQSAIKRMLNYASFSVSALFYGLFFAKRPDVIYAYHPPLTVGIVAVLIRLFRHVPVVYDIQDMWPDTLRATGMISNPKLLGLVSKVCDWVYRYVDHIVVLSPGFKRLLIQRGVTDSKIDVIYNWCDEKSLLSPQGELPSEFPSSDKFRILFAGNMGKAQALTAVLDAAEILKNTVPEIRFVFLGGGVEVERLKLHTKSKSLKNIVFLEPVPMAEVGLILSSADVLMVHLRKDPLFAITIPSKTQAYMAVGKPILMAVEGDAASLVTEANCGLIAQSEDAKSIAASALALFKLPSDKRQVMAINGERYYRERLSLSVGVSQFSKVFKRLSESDIA